ncbi:M48 family metallopeptidase [Thalassotalea sp. Y01]|uniref:M48 family metallopeptidase n=1 Tax=Thalassotalea sp. Y01 TaxID=2729613 RepID=UPI00145F8E23|nr:M48 family metallopeptidase [Thalassotalea sp. Y01]NMP16022.1 M48 family metalloprotease [Thalassotalea sp. Y01]
MDFFQAQQNARRNTWRLGVLFLAAVFSLIAMTYLLVMALQAYLALDPDQALSMSLMTQQFEWRTAIFVACIVAVVIFSGSAYKSISLGSGGKKIAELLGGQRVTHDSKDANEKMLLNVVEEMAIASGTPVPGVYILAHEPAINAFAAGYNSSDAVIGVTRGCIERLSREELQGVVAHEFSHLLNGDTRLNMRLIGVLHGILIIGYIGYYILRTVRGNNKNTGAFLALGLGLIVIGFSGNFFGGLIKAGVSRQREYLADASAVQFTRSKEGIAGALYKIGHSDHGSLLDTPLAPQMSHAYFSSGVSSFVESMFATHPPLDKRIERISPHFKLQRKINEQQREDELKKQQRQQAKEQKQAKKEQFAKTLTSAVVAQKAIESVGKISDNNIDYAQQLLLEMPVNVIDAVRTPHGAQAFVYALILEADESLLKAQLSHLKEHCPTDVLDNVFALRITVGKLQRRFRLPLIDMSVPLLQSMDESQYKKFTDNIQVLIDIDQHISLFEWILQKIITRHVGSSFSRANKLHKQRRLQQCYAAVEVLFSTLLHQLVSDDDEKQRLLPLVRQVSDMSELRLLSADKCQFSDLDGALQTLVELQVKEKPRILRACLLIATGDKSFTHQEMELVRAIADTLDCPMPPNLVAS